MGNRGIHTKPNKGLTDDWLTPPEIIKDLGPFGIDPCASQTQPWGTAKIMVKPPKNGLLVPWHKYGMFWLNPPYGQATKTWLKKATDEVEKGAQGFALVPARTEVTSWFFPYIWNKADALLFIKGRLYFLRPDGSKSGNAGHGSVIAAYGSDAVERLDKSSIEGRLVHLK